MKNLMANRTRTVISGLATAVLVAGLVLTWNLPAMSATAPCQPSGPPGGTYTLKLCLTEPAVGSTLTGDVRVRATITPTGTVGTGNGVSRTEWSLGGQYLLTDYQSPHEFTLSTADFADGTYAIGVDAVMRDGYISPETTATVTFANGNVSAPVNNRRFTVPPIRARGPQEPFVVGAVGDGAGGETNSTNVSNTVVGWNPDLFLYLGDVYDQGTLTEFKNWYGGPSAFYGRLRGVTTPVVGNHEYAGNKAPGYVNFWDNIPNYYHYDANGWHFIAIDSTSNYGQVAPGSLQYDRLASDLAASRSPCTMVFFHHPLFTVGSEAAAERMRPMWDLMAANHVTLVVNGHDHQYQRWLPMGAGGVLDPNGMVQLVAGTGGHSSQPVTGSNPAVAKTSKTYGALRMELFGNHADVRYDSTNPPASVDTSSVSCKGPDGLAPTTPTAPTATPDAAGTVSVGWTASTDNFGVTGYRVYRDGAAVADLPGTATTWTDASVAGATRYEYAIDALDGAGNRSGRTAPVAVTTTGADGTPPTAPGNLAAAVSPTAVSLTWAPASDNVGVVGYEVRRDGVPAATVDAPATTYADSAVPADEPHTWTVVARDAVGNVSAESNGVTAVRDTQPPSTPTGLTTTGVVPGSISLAWDASTDNVGVAQYRLYRDGTPLATVPGTTTRYTDNTPDSTAQSHTYRVQAADAADNTSAMSDPLTVIPADNTPPSVPADLRALTVSANRVDLSWSPSTDDVGLAGYTVYRGGTVVATTTATTFSDTAVLSETSYTYTVVARDTSGHTSAPSAPVAVTTPTLPPFIPVADTYARASNPTSNYGRATTLRVDGDPVTNGYLKFTVTGLNGSVARARLKLFVTAGSSNGFVVRRVADSSWSETAVNWSNAPAVDGGPAVAASGRTTTGRWVTIDITPAVTGNGTFTVALTPAGTSSSYGSRESTTTPQLLVDVTS